MDPQRRGGERPGRWVQVGPARTGAAGAADPRRGGVSARVEYGELLDEGEVVAAGLVPRRGAGRRIRSAQDLP